MAGTTGVSSASGDVGQGGPGLDAAVRYLQNVQNSDGGFGGGAGAESDPVFTAWVALALAAAGVNPQDQMRPGGQDAYSYLTAHAGELGVTTDFERALLVADAAGASPHEFGGVDLVQSVLQRKLSDGSFAHQLGDRTAGVNDTVFAILALAPVQEPAAQAAVGEAATWLVHVQDEDGSWPSTCAPGAGGCNAGGAQARGEVDATAVTIEALRAAEASGASPPMTVAEQKAFRYLHEVQNFDGGFPEYAGEAQSNVASTAWAVQAIWSAGDDPQTWTKAGRDPLQFMSSLQQPDGSVRWKVDDGSNPVWMTAYVAPALAGRWLPIAQVPRAAPVTPSTSGAAGGESNVTQSLGGAGQGGESTRSGRGVIAGGGGKGARLFSRPQPQSRGDTPGGARRLRAARSHAASDRPRREAKQSADSATATADTSSKAGGHTAAGDTRRARPSAARGAAKTAGKDTADTARVGAGAGGAGSAAPVVKGVLIGAPDAGHGANPLQTAAAPGLQSAGAGGGSSSLALAIAGAIAMLAAAGLQLERRRPQEVL